MKLSYLDDEELEATRKLHGLDKKKRANTDTTYCINEICMSKCWRHINNWEFDKNKDYWLMEYCEEERKRICRLLGVDDKECLKKEMN